MRYFRRNLDNFYWTDFRVIDFKPCLNDLTAFLAKPFDEGDTVQLSHGQYHELLKFLTSECWSVNFLGQSMDSPWTAKIDLSFSTFFEAVI